MSHDGLIIAETGESRELLPLPDAGITTRVATMNDLPAIDALQKQFHKQLGFFPRAQMEGYITNGWVIVAEEEGIKGLGIKGLGQEQKACLSVPNPLIPSPLIPSPRILGYCASRDRYLKRDELGAVYQLCVDPTAQRRFVGANLLRAVFERASYGCKLFCCWCAQDLAANRFWEAMGFVPLAYRAGSEKRGGKGGARVHIFWQKRIRQGDEQTPWWFPSKTEGGAIREDRIVLPIPPGTHWSQAKPLILPGMQTQRALPEKTVAKVKRKPIVMRRQFGPPSMTMPQPEPIAKEPKAKREKQKADPRLIAAARELRDRWLEEINEVPLIGAGKYQVARLIEAKKPKTVKAKIAKLPAKPVAAKQVKRLAA